MRSGMIIPNREYHSDPQRQAGQARVSERVRQDKSSKSIT